MVSWTYKRVGDLVRDREREGEGGTECRRDDRTKTASLIGRERRRKREEGSTGEEEGEEEEAEGEQMTLHCHDQKRKAGQPRVPVSGQVNAKLLLLSQSSGFKGKGRKNEIGMPFGHG